ncbi:beta-mannosidase [Rhizobium sp. ERR 922]|uniref:glycoside hydrolase family 2 protein n=1 Tax=unclassified Rhizobium TaxID=2613769 RepID=UPI00119ED78F|nr:MULTISPECIES: glycoside hydrolase family 2 protein [unclassified Rhizobium]TWB57837.1 beta-mannosidase [Rhizobium sp. ERR 922]TWB99532.1 beta-mannosidase [Rhizobium sp. ERR 942]
MKRQTLDTGWIISRLRAPSSAPALPNSIPATVPGNVHLDLMAAQLITDPYLDVNEISQDWIGRAAWRYRLAFDWDGEDAERIDLSCLGLDTAARLELNGSLLGETRNMHRSYRFGISDHLKSGRNELIVDFQSAYELGEEVRKQLGSAADIPQNYPGPSNLIRKMACNFGWDWGPTVVTSGIWKPVVIESWSKARLGSIRPEITLQGSQGVARLHVEIEWADKGTDSVALVLSVGGKRAEVRVAQGETHALIECRIDNPQVWWPHGMGGQPLYDLDLQLLGSDGAALDGWKRRVGFRSVRLDTTPDEVGSAFTLVVNDVPVFARGANWIPDDCFLPRVTRKRYRERIAQARDANMNMLRVWGGGIYETDTFYEECDAAGIMVWQDFLFACATYPEEEPVYSEIEAEAREAITRLMPYASLVIWNGNNENIWGYFDWGWQDVLGNRPWGAGYYLDLLPKLVAEIDPTRPYWPGSPYSGSMDIAPNADEHGCRHIWDVWNEVGYETYRNYIPRFCSEFGWQAPPAFATLAQSVREKDRAPASPAVLHHQKATGGNDKLLQGLEGWFPHPQNFDDWLFVTQLNQARAISYGIDHMRSHRPTCMGTIVWQLNDCWPVTSWAAVDGAGRKKPLWYALKHSYAPHLLTIQPRGDGLAAVAVNDATLFWRVPFTVERFDFTGKLLARHHVWRILCDRFENTDIDIPSEVATPGDPRREYLRARLGDAEAWRFFEKDMQLQYPQPRFDIESVQTPDEIAITITAQSFLRDVCLFVDRISPNAEVDDMLVNLAPGESRTFKVKGISKEAFDDADLSAVIRTANQVAEQPHH